jgi:foldase protein PrsA
MKKLAGLLLALASCEPSAAPPAPPPGPPEPDRITVQHILVSFAGAGTRAKRTREEAERLAADLFEKVKKDGDFDALMKQYSDDSGPGIYAMANHGIPLAGPEEYARGRMVAAFGNVGFRLEVGAIEMSAHDPKRSPFGWHIIKRIK